eukprot:jgi/Botrbrau1/14009/Bobra.0296s0003.1
MAAAAPGCQSVYRVNFLLKSGYRKSGASTSMALMASKAAWQSVVQLKTTPFFVSRVKGADMAAMLCRNLL